jgi:uncharacterized protein HemY
MSRNIITFVVIVLLAAGLFGSVYAGYAGYGMIQAGGSSARVGSIGGPLVVGGGIGSGK